MGQNSTIEWTTHTLNPWIGCSKVSAGCANCYAEALMDKRWGKVQWGPAGERKRTSESNWREPLKWNRLAKAAGERHRVFCASLADVFEDRPELVPWRNELCELIERCRNLDWLLLTKRPENINRMIGAATGRLPEAWFADCKHVWTGTSIENQAVANERIPELLRVPAAVRFLSCELLLGPIDLQQRKAVPLWWQGDLNPLSRIHWVIIGGESGHGARPCNVAWIRSIIAQCQAASVSCFVKQLGSNVLFDGIQGGYGDGPSNCWPAGTHTTESAGGWRVLLKDKKGGDISEFPADLRVRQFPKEIPCPASTAVNS